MAIRVINNGDKAVNVRAAINANFSELEGAINASGGDFSSILSRLGALETQVSNLMQRPGVLFNEWTQNTNYPAHQGVSYNGGYYICKTAHTSGAQFNQTNWDKINTGVVG